MSIARDIHGASTIEMLELALAHIARLLEHSHYHRHSDWIDDCQVAAADFIGSGYIASSDVQDEVPDDDDPLIHITWLDGNGAVSRTAVPMAKDN